jgi:hypothetical protein
MRSPFFYQNRIFFAVVYVASMRKLRLVGWRAQEKMVFTHFRAFCWFSSVLVASPERYYYSTTRTLSRRENSDCKVNDSELGKGLSIYYVPVGRYCTIKMEILFVTP